jgi:hypothetical protein
MIIGKFSSGENGTIEGFLQTLCSEISEMGLVFHPHNRPGVLYSITSSAIAINVGGRMRPSALAVFRLMANSNLVACSTGRSDGLAPPHWRAHLLDMRDKNDLSAPVRTLTGVSKFGICKVENDTKLLHVITVGSITGGDRATKGWIEGTFQGRLAKDCSRAFVPLRRLLRRAR